jgi:hypothetical protein
MNDFCIICHDREDLSDWVHPVSKEQYKICGYCKKSIIGLCQHCRELVFKTDHFGYDDSGNIMCSKCVHMAELSEDSCSR